MSSPPTPTTRKSATLKVYCCNYQDCNKAFKTNARLRRHVNDVHTQQFRYHCWCGFYSTQKENLACHQKIHRKVREVGLPTYPAPRNSPINAIRRASAAVGSTFGTLRTFDFSSARILDESRHNPVQTNADRPHLSPSRIPLLPHFEEGHRILSNDLDTCTAAHHVPQPSTESTHQCDFSCVPVDGNVNLDPQEWRSNQHSFTLPSYAGNSNHYPLFGLADHNDSTSTAGLRTDNPMSQYMTSALLPPLNISQPHTPQASSLYSQYSPDPPPLDDFDLYSPGIFSHSFFPANTLDPALLLSHMSSIVSCSSADFGGLYSYSNTYTPTSPDTHNANCPH
ncbi:hypothetical protein BOTBODRAFT_60172 [Botryobasidium botryosum FD-172 SS1]|uniref:C2H2-type domain-containing protein n=1 Tax=Botryobasidium botryosum (strain FD-172 SS1) TaxID=930990 RepID=A0A067LXW6_BOTB1|nr:hypothetical protein BOTBODRAFT_60172 [Botryobasidium botryosum FD-172 SS1]